MSKSWTARDLAMHELMHLEIAHRQQYRCSLLTDYELSKHADELGKKIGNVNDLLTAGCDFQSVSVWFIKRSAPTVTIHYKLADEHANALREWNAAALRVADDMFINSALKGMPQATHIVPGGAAEDIYNELLKDKQ